VADLKAPDGATILEDPEASVVSIIAPAVFEEAEPSEEEAEAAEGAEGAEAAAEGGSEEA